MKLRINGDSIRLRLTVSEVEQFGKTGSVTDSIDFGGGEDRVLSYSLNRSTDVNTVRTDIGDGKISVSVPNDIAVAWATTGEVGFSGSQDLGNGKAVRILVEKDFVRRKDGPGGSRTDGYPHPDVSPLDDKS